MTYNPIRTQADVSHFLDCTNSLHDAFLIGVECTHSGHTCGNPHYIDPDKAELRLRWLVTSIYDKTVELVFTAPYAWQLRDAGSDITDTAVSFDEKGRIIWTDDSDSNCRDGSYVIAQTMFWRFV